MNLFKKKTFNQILYSYVPYSILYTYLRLPYLLSFLDTSVKLSMECKKCNNKQFSTIYLIGQVVLLWNTYLILDLNILLFTVKKNKKVDKKEKIHKPLFYRNIL